jgi:DNA polymerase/3'-5' exonuclease PolX
MEALMMMLAASMKTEQVLQKLQDELNEYLADPSKEHMNNIGAVCALYLAHLKTGGTMEGAMAMIKDFEQFEKREKLFNPDSKN